MQDFGTKFNDTAGSSGQLSAEEFNNLASELENAVLRSGLALDGASVLQVATSLFLHAVKSQTFQDSGAANSYVATPVSGASGVTLPSNYLTMNGALIFFQAANANTGAATLNIGQTTGTLIGSKNILTQSGSALSGGEIAAGAYIQLRYDAALSAGAGAWVLLPSSRPVASASQAQGLTLNNVDITPAALALAFQGANQSLIGSGYQKLPGGLILQWGASVSVPSGGSNTETLPLAFTTAPLRTAISRQRTSNLTAASSFGYEFVGLTQIKFYSFATNGESQTIEYITLGR